jgi:DNA-binding winged helix-turn-helix (wHTH) protein/tetratricopeptide (TPR) repeat protein
MKDGESVHIQPKVMGVLVCLAQHAPETVTREEIFAEVWADRIVQDQVLDTNISILRSHFETKTNEHAYIKTIHGVGYLLLAETQPLTNKPKTKSGTPVRFMAAAIVVVALALLITISGQLDPGITPDIGFSNDELINVEPRDLASALRTIKLTSLLLLSGNRNVTRRGTGFLQKSISLFRDALAVDSTLIEAHIGLANAYALLPSYDGSDPDVMFANASVELQLAVDLGAEVERTYAIEAFMHLRRMEWIRGEERFRQAIAYDPQNADLRQWYSQLLSKVGFLQSSVSQAKAALRLDESSPVSIQRLGVAYVWVGEDQKAQTLFSSAIQAGIAPFTNPEPKLILRIRQHRFRETELSLRALQESEGLPEDWIPAVMTGIRSGTAEARDIALQSARDSWLKRELSPRFYFGISLLLQDTRNTLAVANQLLRSNALSDVVEGLFLPEARGVRAEPAFLILAEELGLDSYWLRYGPPDMCRTDTKEEFCEQLFLSEAARGQNQF